MHNCEEISPILSLCIPTNGIIEWVFPVLDSIYNGNVNIEKYEVVVEDNGGNTEFEKAIREYQKEYRNLKYYKSSSSGFLCQIDCFKHANGEFVKFVNHRSCFQPGTLEFLVNYAQENNEEKPVVFFSNAETKDYKCDSFDEFVCNLSYMSSWSGGLAFWKKDIEKLSQIRNYNRFFPHTDVLFMETDGKKYHIESKKLFSSIDQGHQKKGKYNLFRVFVNEYLRIIDNLLSEDKITIETRNTIKKDLSSYISELYIQFVLLHKKASYDLTDYRKYIYSHYSKIQFFWSTIRQINMHVLYKIRLVKCEGYR